MKSTIDRFNAYLDDTQSSGSRQQPFSGSTTTSEAQEAARVDVNKLHLIRQAQIPVVSGAAC